MKKYCFDIDGTICTNTDGNYEDAKPHVTRIKQINSLHKEGNKIILFTARGTTTGIDWRLLTENQLKNWSVSYDELLFGKPEADKFIDDKADDIFNWFK
ncbi:hypothetical protein OAH80_03740 [Acidimicrobiia bacterium]|jgi:hypothetical protein|nr:hypothetical protein [Acidimicrobiia bacterium]